MPGTYSVAGRTVSTGATSANQASATLWNPSSTKRIIVWEIGWSTQALFVMGISRTTTRGTVGTTITPDADNSWDNRGAPESGAVLDTNYSAEPTKAAKFALSIYTGSLIAQQSATMAVMLFKKGILVKPGNGLCVHRIHAITTASNPIGDIYFVWDEGYPL